jgi:hypothetical protein
MLSSPRCFASAPTISKLRNGLYHGRGWQEAERAYLLWKARQVADAAASFAAAPVVAGRTRAEGKRRRVEAVSEELRGRAAARGGGGLPGVTVVVAGRGGEKSRMKAAVLEHAVQSLKPGVFEELMEMMGWHEGEGGYGKGVTVEGYTPASFVLSLPRIAWHI